MSGVIRLCVFSYSIALVGVVAIAHIHPQRPLWLERTPQFAEYRHKLIDENLRRFFQPDLTIHAVVAQTVVGRRGDDAVHAIVRQ